MALAGQGPADELVPAGFRLCPDPGSRTLAGGTLITGGYPIRVLRLTQPGPGMSPPGGRARRCPIIRRPARWRAASSTPGSPIRAGTAPPSGEASVTVVIPVRDRHAELARCLAGLAEARRVIVVDDGSRDPAAIQSVAAGPGLACCGGRSTAGPRGQEHRPGRGGHAACRVS